jgi:protein phosphatase
VVADGMGGHRAGEVASRIVVETVADFVRSSDSDRQITWPFGLDLSVSFEANQLRNAVHLAHQKVRFEAQRRSDYAGMGSTVVAARLRGRSVVFCNVGDSRLYLFRRGALSQLSTDHSWAASMLRAGSTPEMIQASPMRHVLTKALGSDDDLELGVSAVTLETGDLLLLCSDGLHGALEDRRLGEILGDWSGPLQPLAEHLIDEANAAGGPDNITAVLARHAPAPGRSR